MINVMLQHPTVARHRPHVASRNVHMRVSIALTCHLAPVSGVSVLLVPLCFLPPTCAHRTMVCATAHDSERRQRKSRPSVCPSVVPSPFTVRNPSTVGNPSAVRNPQCADGGGHAAFLSRRRKRAQPMLSRHRYGLYTLQILWHFLG